MTLNDERPHLTVEIYGVPFRGLLDSGASCTVMSKEAMRELPVSLISTKITLTTANEGPLEVLGTFTAPVRYSNKTYQVPTIVVRNLSHDLILGYDFWRIAGLKITHRIDEVHAPPKTIRKSPTALTPAQQQKFEEAKDLFLIGTEQVMGRTHLLQHEIELIDGAKPFYARPHLFSPEMETRVGKELDKMLALGVVVPSKSPVASAIVPVEKPDGSVRLCLDSRLLNAITVKDKFPVPNVGHILARIQKTRYLSSVDLSKAFWQVPLSNTRLKGQFATAQELTAFIVPGRGLFHFKVMPFGLVNSAATQCRLMALVLGHDLEPHVFCYMDDIILLGRDADHMVGLISEVARRLRAANLAINMDKCQFFVSEMKFLGFVLTETGLKADPSRLAVMQEYPPPRNIRGVRRFLGMTGYYRRLIRDYSGIAAPLTYLTKKSHERLIWTEREQEAFDNLKKAMMSAPVVANPDFGLEFHIQCDASDVSAAAALGQFQEGKEVVISYYSHKWTSAEAKWGATEREGACVLYAIRHFRGYVWGRMITIITDAQALIHLKTVKTDGSSRLARWALELNQYQLTIKHRSGKLSVVPDALSRALEEITSQEPNETEDPWYQEMIGRLQSNPAEYPDFRLQTNRLFKYESCLDDIGCFQYRWKEYVPITKRTNLIERLHQELGHLGASKCSDFIRTRFFWPGLVSSVEKEVRKCAVCKASKSPHQLTRVPMGKNRIADVPFRMIALDHWGPVTRSSRGNLYLLVVVDIFSKYVLLHPCRDTKAPGVTKFLEEQVFQKFGTPEILITDNFRALIGRSMVGLLNQYGVQHWTIAYYHSQGNPAERYIRTVSTAIRCYVIENQGDQRKWDEKIGMIQMALNNTVHEATRKTPFFINFGREMVWTGTEYEQLEGAPRDRRNLTTNQLRQQFQNVHAEVLENLQRAHQRSRNYYDERTTPLTFIVGEEVWRRQRHLSNAGNQFSAKLAPRYLKCRIMRQLGTDTYEVQDPGGPVMKYHANDLYKDR